MDPIPTWDDGEDAEVVYNILIDLIGRVNLYDGSKADTAHGHAAGDIAFTPIGNLSAETVGAALAELDGEKLAKGGGTMTGPLVLAGAPTETLHAASKGYVDALFGDLDIAIADIDGLQGALDGKASTSHTHTVPFYWLDFLDYDPTLSSNSSEKVPVTSAVKGYADTKLSKAGGTMTGAITLAGDAASALQPVTKQQLEAALLNMGKRTRVRVKTTGDVNLGGGLVAGATVDGVTVAPGDLVLVASQSTASQNGVYTVPASGSAPRAAEFDTFDEHPGSLVTVAEGSTQADTVWLCTSNAGGTLGSTAIAFSQLRVAGELLAANNLSDLADAATARSNLGVVIGTHVQAYNANLAAFAGLSLIADRLPYANGTGTLALTPFSALGRTVVGIANGAAGCAAIGAAQLSGANFTGSIIIGSGAGSSPAYAEIGSGRIADGVAYFDLVADVATYPDYGFRFTRNSGANGTTQLIHRGTGGLNITTVEAAPVVLNVGNTQHTILELDGSIKMGVAGAVVISASRHHQLRSYTVATLPSAASAGQMIYVSDGTSNKRMAVSDGTNWRFPDGNIVS